MARAPGCTVTGYQQVCVDADIALTATAGAGDAVVTCLRVPTIQPRGATTCAPTGVPCGFSAQATLCVAVPVSFGATATTTDVRQQCRTPTATSCFPTCPFFQPKSQGFLRDYFNLTGLPANAVCSAVECVKANSSFLASLLPAPCPAPEAPCPGDLADLGACAARVTALMTQAGAEAALTPLCPTPPSLGALPATLRQLVAVLLDVCLCATTADGVDVGGVTLHNEVDLSGVSEADLIALGLTAACVGVGDVVAEANSILATCDRALAGLIAPILTAMAQDAADTIIRPVPCP